MKSRAQISGHPLHQILVNFPVAFFTGTLIFDTLAALTAKTALGVTGYYMNIAGIAGALLAAVPGFLDYLFTVPPKSSASSRAAKHGLLNVSVLLLFAFLLWYRQTLSPSPVLMCSIEVVAVALLFVAGWMGGTLVTRNQIGTDIRYAGAGKWKEVFLKTRTGPVRVAGRDELKLNQMMLIHMDDKRIVVARTEEGYVAFDDRCTHRGGSLAGGSMICGTVQCPWHGSQFDVRTGALKAGPAKSGITSYSLEERGEDVILLLPS